MFAELGGGRKRDAQHGGGDRRGDERSEHTGGHGHNRRRHLPADVHPVRSRRLHDHRQLRRRRHHVKIKLTPAGVELLRHSTDHRLTTNASAKPTIGSPPLKAITSFL